MAGGRTGRLAAARSGSLAIIAVIPARYASSRLPGKPLLRETGKYLIRHVWERVLQAEGPVQDFYVATDDSRVFEAVKSFGGKAMLTRADHPSGTDRVPEDARALKHPAREFVINIQRDQPEIDTKPLVR
ncbi:MAG: hypothetical protein HY873_13340, partial [Chloroflexi bacterium]|nr:hypothetical protein [Chloroflexota bacterium]